VIKLKKIAYNIVSFTNAEKASSGGNRKHFIRSVSEEKSADTKEKRLTLCKNKKSKVSIAP